MTTHTCPRCGLESRCSRSSWPDRHPTATVIGVTLVSVFTLVVVVGYPWLLLVGAVGYVVYVIDREYRRRRALAARADWDYRELMSAPVTPPRALPALPPVAPRPQRAEPRRRGADHWSRTEPFSIRN